MKKANNLYDKAYAFAVRIVNAYHYLKRDKREFVMSEQLPRSGNSVGANIAEANGAISTADFSAKISIAYNKECLETKYGLSLPNEQRCRLPKRRKKWKQLCSQERILRLAFRNTDTKTTRGVPSTEST